VKRNAEVKIPAVETSEKVPERGAGLGKERLRFEGKRLLRHLDMRKRWE